MQKAVCWKIIYLVKNCQICPLSGASVWENINQIGSVLLRYSEDTPPFTLARFIGDDDNENVLLKVRSALERVTSDYHSETSSDDDGVCISPPPENDSAFTTPPPERDSGYGTASPKNIFCARPSPDNNSISATSSPPNRRGGATTPPQNRSPPMQVHWEKVASKTKPMCHLPLHVLSIILWYGGEIWVCVFVCVFICFSQGWLPRSTTIGSTLMENTCEISCWATTLFHAEPTCQALSSGQAS